jgi:putative ABC transport system permease protein
VKYLPLIWAGLWRKPVRSVLTFFCIAVAFLLFGLLNGITVGFESVVEAMGANRVRVSSDNRRDPLPIAYLPQIKQVPNVRSATIISGWGLYYQDRRNGVSNAALGGDVRFNESGEVKIPLEQVNEFKRTRTGAVVGKKLADKYGWKLGQRLVLMSYMPKADGTNNWEFDIVGIFETGEKSDLAEQIWYHFEYLDEMRAPSIRGTAGSFVVRTTDAKYNAQASAAIDALFANSEFPTATQSDRGWQRENIKRTFDINLFVNTVVGASLFTLLLLTGNSMMQSVRQRIPEFAVMKTMGYTDTLVLILVLIESLLLCIGGAVAGLLAAKALFPVFAAAIELRGIDMPPVVVATGFAIAIVAALLSASLPAWRARQLSVVDALAHRQ